MKRDALTKIHKAAYAVGHFANDLQAAVWFTYATYYVKEVIGLNDLISALVILSGYIGDALTPPFVGFWSDKTDTKMGKRQPWYLGGSILAIPAFLAIFITPRFAENDVDGVGTSIYYITWPLLWNFGKYFSSKFNRLGQCSDIHYVNSQPTYFKYIVN